MSTSEYRAKRREYMRRYRAKHRQHFAAQRQRRAALRDPAERSNPGRWSVSEFHNAATGLPICVIAHRMDVDVLSKLMQRQTPLGEAVRRLVASGELRREYRWLPRIALHGRVARGIARGRRTEIVEWCGGRSPLISDRPKMATGWKQPERRPRVAPSTKRRSVVVNGVGYRSLRAAARAAGVSAMTILRWLRAGRFDTPHNG